MWIFAGTTFNSSVSALQPITRSRTARLKYTVQHHVVLHHAAGRQAAGDGSRHPSLNSRRHALGQA